MIKAILIDDEEHCLDTLSMLLDDYCPQVKVMDRFDSAKKALPEIRELNPDLVFLDIEMPMMNGFELLDQFKPIPFQVIFTTSYDQYAIKAIRFSALDYLLKPIEAKELVAAVHKAELQKNPPSMEQFQMLRDHVHHREGGFSKIAVPTVEGYELIPIDSVLRCEADNNYTHLFLKNKTKVIACRTLKEMEQQLEYFDYFIRVHHSFIVNLNEVTKYIRGEGGYVVMSDGSSVNVSRSRKDALMRRF